MSLLFPNFFYFLTSFFDCTEHASWHFGRKIYYNPTPSFLCANSPVNITLYVNLELFFPQVHHFSLIITEFHLHFYQTYIQYTHATLSSQYSLLLSWLRTSTKDTTIFFAPFFISLICWTEDTLLDFISNLSDPFQPVVIPWELFYKWLIHVKELSFHVRLDFLRTFDRWLWKSFWKFYMAISTISSLSR